MLYCEAFTDKNVFGLNPSGTWKITVLSLIFLKALPLSKMIVTMLPHFWTILHVVLPCPIASAWTYNFVCCTLYKFSNLYTIDQ
nr:MAG TPA: hypothetical protein [Caudoviricetes sp.]